MLTRIESIFKAQKANPRRKKVDERAKESLKIKAELGRTKGLNKIMMRKIVL